MIGAQLVINFHLDLQLIPINAAGDATGAYQERLTLLLEQSKTDLSFGLSILGAGGGMFAVGGIVLVEGGL